MASFQVVIFALGTFPPAVHLWDLHSIRIFGDAEPRSNACFFLACNPTGTQKF